MVGAESSKRPNNFDAFSLDFIDPGISAIDNLRSDAVDAFEEVTLDEAEEGLIPAPKICAAFDETFTGNADNELESLSSEVVSEDECLLREKWPREEKSPTLASDDDSDKSSDVVSDDI